MEKSSKSNLTKTSKSLRTTKTSTSSKTRKSKSVIVNQQEMPEIVNNSFKFEHTNNLTDIEKSSLRRYTEGEDYLINKLLRLEKKDFKDFYNIMNQQEVYDISKKINYINDMVNIIDNIMQSKASVANDDLIVYRGTKTNRDIPYLGVNTGYISTSKSINAIEKNSFRFLGEDCCIYVYTIKKGVPYLDLSEISFFGKQHEHNQEEILLPRGLKTKLVSTNENSEIHGKKYKTYNVTIELNKQDKYNYQPINNSKIIYEFKLISGIINNVFQLRALLSELYEDDYYNYSDDENEVIKNIIVSNNKKFGDENYDFYEKIDELIENFLTKPFKKTLNDYNKYLIKMINSFDKKNVLKNGDKERLQNIQSYVDNIITSNV
jgi:hypothetical protein